ncbi:MAG: polysaccharide biosynthesis protein, partial [Pseudomonadota bacterium]
DRFGLSVEVKTPTDIETRIEIMRLVASQERDPQAFEAEWAAEDEKILKQIARGKNKLAKLVPGEDVKIQYTGLRPGEKLREVLAYDFEDISHTSVDGVLSVNGGTDVDDRFDLMLKQLLRAAERRERIEALALLGRLVPQYGASQSAANQGLGSA